MEIGVYTFVENTPDPATGRTLPATQRLRDLMEEIALADQVGLDVFGIGEHHRPDFLASAPPISGTSNVVIRISMTERWFAGPLSQRLQQRKQR